MRSADDAEAAAPYIAPQGRGIFAFTPPYGNGSQHLPGYLTPLQANSQLLRQMGAGKSIVEDEGGVRMESMEQGHQALGARMLLPP